VTTLRLVAIGLALLPIALLLAGQAGLLSGKRPADLGAVDGRLSPVREDLRNAVSSTAGTARHRIPPLAPVGEPEAAFARVRALVAADAGARLVTERSDYLHAEYTTRWLRFVDDVEFLLDPRERVIHVRSASRLGRSDFGVNRARIESIRARLDAPR
jgi:uncharacterized protein (DUF1499 family)